jgi:hypothetical protein
VERTTTASTFGLWVRGLRGAIFGISAFLVTSCLTGPAVVTLGNESPPRARTPEARALTVVLLAIDGVRWQEIFGGVDHELAARHRIALGERLGAKALMPNLHALVDDGGVLLGGPDSGTEVFASGPAFVSLPG